MDPLSNVIPPPSSFVNLVASNAHASLLSDCGLETTETETSLMRCMKDARIEESLVVVYIAILLEFQDKMQ